MSEECEQAGLEKFKILEDPNIEGLTSELLTDLDDITRKWGIVNVPLQIVQFKSGDLGFGFELVTIAPIEPDKKGLLVLKAEFSDDPNDNTTFADPRAIKLIATSDGPIYWSKDLQTYSVEQIIASIDDRVRPHGLIDERDGKRIAFPNDMRINKKVR